MTPLAAQYPIRIAFSANVKMTPLRQQLKDSFGFDEFLPGQERVLENLMAGHSAAAVFPTGGGKSLCYQLPALLLPGLTLVVSPLIALMKDQIDQLKRLGIAAERLDSTLTAAEYRAIMDAIRGGRLRLLYVAPERFNNERFRETLDRIDLPLLAVDEAHCISEWGHNFRPDYLKLSDYALRYRAGRVLALTATATPRVLEDICRAFQVDPERAVRTGFHRPNLELLSTPVAFEDRDSMLVRRLKERPLGSTIVYVTLQRTSEEVAERLVAAGFSARPYHAGMKDEERAEVQDWFLASKSSTVVATIAFGMGIDKPNIRYVYHYNLPKSLENLSQEIGRAGRDGNPSICESFVCPDDLTVLENFAFGDTPALEGIRGLVQELAAAPDQFDLSLYELSRHHDIRLLVVRTLLTYLELKGLLEGRTPTFSVYRFRPLAPSQEILGRFSGERRSFLAALFQQAKKAKVWFDIDLVKVSRTLGAPRDRLVRALDYLAEQELIELRVGGIRQRYHWRQRAAELDQLALELHAKTLEHEGREIERLGRVLDLAALDGCQTRALCSYFGEILTEDCGHCGWCLGGQRPAELLPRSEAAIVEDLWNQAIQAREAHAEVLAEPRAFSRFLTGLRSPSITSARLAAHPLFGTLEQVPFASVLERVLGEAVSSKEVSSKEVGSEAVR